jgi:hypothetical protein
MLNITKERKEEILKIYNGGKHDLFNWCEEYKVYINQNIHRCVSSEWEYILKKSYEDSNAPLSYEDLDMFDVDNAIDIILVQFDDSEERLIELANDPDTYNRRVKNKDDFEVFLKSLEKDELRDVFEQLDLDICEAEGEVYEWWIIDDRLSVQLEDQGEIMLNGAWGRQTTGQHISLDGACMKAFLTHLEQMYTI